MFNLDLLALTTVTLLCLMLMVCQNSWV